MADTFEDLDLFATIPQTPQDAPQKPAAARATYLRPHTRYHSEIRLSDDPSGIIRVVSNERLGEFGLTWHPASA